MFDGESLPLPCKLVWKYLSHKIPYNAQFESMMKLYLKTVSF